MDPVILLWACGALAFVALALWADIQAVDHMTRARADRRELIPPVTEEDA